MISATRQKTPLRFFRGGGGKEPVREWLKSLDAPDRHAVGLDLMRAQWRWPFGMPPCRPMGQGPWEVRTDLPSHRIVRVLLCLHEGEVVALHGFIKKTQQTPGDELALARQRQKELTS
ncbi:MAG: type II toxin-antitoxin system RelE/ParE family toxin [Rubrivivax sp.]|nr:type II toxin-antitoxin system RelE/ParE family toxin [Rubrivivax sp.]